jgi:hypothetical protein
MAAHHHAICDEGSDGSRWFVSNGHKVMTALSCHVIFKLLVWRFSLQFYR